MSTLVLDNDTEIDFDAAAVTDEGIDPDFDRWFAEMIRDDESDDDLRAEDADWNENIFED